MRIAHWMQSARARWMAKPVRQLRLRETLGLGEKRFLAIVEFERQRFLIGGTPSSVSLLAELRGNAVSTTEKPQAGEPQ